MGPREGGKEAVGTEADRRQWMRKGGAQGQQVNGWRERRGDWRRKEVSGADRRPARREWAKGVKKRDPDWGEEKRDERWREGGEGKKSER